jgi:hypothetical protein
LQELLSTINDVSVTLAFSKQLRDASEDLGRAVGAITEWATMRGEKARHHVSKPWHELRSADAF